MTIADYFAIGVLIALALGAAAQLLELLSKDEARRIAVNIAKLPELLSRRPTWECDDQ